MKTRDSKTEQRFVDCNINTDTITKCTAVKMEGVIKK